METERYFVNNRSLRCTGERREDKIRTTRNEKKERRIILKVEIGWKGGVHHRQRITKKVGDASK